jgi:hypothetical protein
LDGELERDKMPLASKKRLNAEDKRVKFRELMLCYDVRYGARDSEGDLIARY